MSKWDVISSLYENKGREEKEDRFTPGLNTICKCLDTIQTLYFVGSFVLSGHCGHYDKVLDFNVHQNLPGNGLE